MSELSAETWTLVDRLRSSSRSMWNPFSRKIELQIELLTAIGESGETAALWAVVGYVFQSNRRVAEAAALASHRLISSVPPAKCEEFIQTFRQALSYVDESICNLPANDMAYLLSFGEASVSLISLTTLHWNGYVREAALRSLPEPESGIELPFLLLRLNDWVEPVRLAAAIQLERRLVLAYCRHFVRNITLVNALLGRSRADHHAFIDSVRSLLRRAESREALLEGLDSDDVRVRRLCFDIALDAEGLEIDALINRAASDNDPMIRLWAVRQAVNRLSGEVLRAFLKELSKDRFVPVRKEAIYAYGKEPAVVSQPVLRTALLDSNRWVREAARPLPGTCADGLRCVLPKRHHCQYRKQTQICYGGPLRGWQPSGCGLDTASGSSSRSQGRESSYPILGQAERRQLPGNLLRAVGE